jgi:hypothetical protein
VEAEAPADGVFWPVAVAEVDGPLSAPVSELPSQAVRASAAKAIVVAANRRVRVVRADMKGPRFDGSWVSRSTGRRERLLG